MSFTIDPYNMANFRPLTACLGAPQQISTGFASCLRYCSNVAHRRPTKLCTMFGRLVRWYAMYTFSGALAPWSNIHFTSKSCVLLYWQRYCTALSSGRQPNFAAWYKEWNYGTFAEGATYIRLGGHHAEHRPTFYFFYLLHRISRLSTVTGVFDVERRSLTLFPVLPKPEVVFPRPNGGR